MGIFSPKSLGRYVPFAGYLFIGPSALMLALLGAWIVASGVPSVRGVDLNVVYTLQKAFRLPLYTDPASVPFDIAQYPPVYYLTVLGAARIVGIDADDTVALIALARGISFACALALVAGLYTTSQRVFELPPTSALVIGGLAFILTSPWFFLARPDAMAALLAMASIAAIAGPRPIGMLRLFASMTFAMAAIFTKQNEVQVLVACLGYLAVAHGWRSAAVGAITAAVLGVLALGVCLWQWPHFISNVVGGVDNGIDFRHFVNKTLTNYLYPQVTLVALAALAVLRWSHNPADTCRGLFVVALPVLFAFSTGMGLKVGSAENYFNEFTLLALVATALLLCRPAKDRTGPALEAPALISFVGLVLLACLPLWTKSQLHYWWDAVDRSISLVVPPDSLRDSRYRQLASSLNPAVLGGDGYVLAFSLPVNVALSAPMIVPQKELAYISYQRGVVDYAGFRRLIDQGRVPYLIMGPAETKPPDSFLGASFDGYVPIETVGAFTVFGRAAN